MNRLTFVVVPIVAIFVLGPGQGQEFENAGVLPYSTSSGETRVLFGFDAERESWGDFVGVCTPEETPPQTAAREFVEETREAYQFSEVLVSLQQIDPVAVGPTRIFLMEVREIPAAQLASMAKSRYSEKTNYCWVSVQALLQSIDDDGPGRAKVPETCGGSYSDLFDLVGENLVEGSELRRRLLDPSGAGPSTSLGMRPRCGR